MLIWEFILHKLTLDQKVMLLVVVESSGSSPGRQGFKMAVSTDGNFHGTIGGGIMEHKLVEKAKDLLIKSKLNIHLIEQHHDKIQAKNQSGMICSGSQAIAFIPLTKAKDLVFVDQILSNSIRNVQFSNIGLNFSEILGPGFHFVSENKWSYVESSDTKPTIHIVGGGHVGLALSELMLFLGFYIKIYEDRPEVQTLLDNSFAHEKIIIPSYDLLSDCIKNSANDYIVLMTVGYRTDKEALKSIWNVPCAYLGMLGSDFKVKTLLSELKSEGFDSADISQLFTPIGLPIYSKTTQEIAVSIAAEIIREKNKKLPTGRNGKFNL